MTTIEIRPGEQVALVGDNDSGKSRLAAAFAGSRNAKYITFRDSYGSYGDRNFFMQQRWNLFTLDWDPPTVDGRPLVTFSSGELRKYQLARALEGNPEVVVIDNPYIGLDPANRTYLSRHLTELSASTTFLLVLSRVAEIPPFITHVIPVKDGVAGEKVTREAFLDATLPPAVIRMRNVTIRFGERVILDSLNWTVREGEHWALTGANGSGKSTLLSLVNADNPQAYAHDIELFGRPRGSGESIWDIKRNITGIRRRSSALPPAAGWKYSASATSPKSVSCGSPAGSSGCAWWPAPSSRIRRCTSWMNPCKDSTSRTAATSRCCWTASAAHPARPS